MLAQLKAIFDNTIDGLLTLDGAGTIESFNPACEKIFGYAASDAVGRNFRLLLADVHHAEYDGYLRQYRETGKAPIIGKVGPEVRGRRRDGAIFPMDLSIAAFDLEDGQHFCGIIRDISERRRMERDLRYAEARALALFNSATDGLMTLDAFGLIQTFNPACERMFGYEEIDAIGMNVRELLGGKDLMVAPEAAVQTVTGRRRDGATFPMELSLNRFALDDDIYFCGIVRDVTRARNYEAERQSLLERLIETNTELERFAYVASHDMQEPVRMIANFSQILLDEYQDKLGDDGREYLQILGGSAERLKLMIKDLLHYARLGRDGATFAEIDLFDQLNYVRENLSELIRETGAVVEIEPLPRVEGNGMQLLRLFQNLIANAIKYQPDGGTPQVRISVRDEGTHWCFCVADNGVGIDGSFHQQVFEPFRRLHDGRQAQGSGLGLAICRKIVENHDGRIWVESTPGDGSHFYFTLSKSLNPARAPKEDTGS